MLRTFKYRIYPNPDQIHKIDNTINVCRFVYNLALETKTYAYRTQGKSLTKYDLINQLPALKKDNKWMYEPSATALQQEILRLNDAFTNYFNGSGYPKFRQRKSIGSFISTESNTIDWNQKTLSIAKIKNIKIILSRKFIGNIKRVIITRSATGKYFVSILVQTQAKSAPPGLVSQQTTIGIDLGIKSFVVTSDGNTFDANRKLKNSLKRLQCLQRRASRKKKGSNNQKKAYKQVAIIHEKITNQRLDYIHKITTKLTRDSQANTFVIEDLNVFGMLRNKNLSQSLQDVSFGEFIRQMKYKCEWHGKNLMTIGRFEPTSKTCSACGELNHELTLADREWTCKCGATHDRDLNAAINIKNAGLKKYSSEGIGGEPVELRRLRRAKKQETTSIPPIQSLKL